MAVKTPSPAGEGWGEEIKINCLYSPHPSLLPQGEGAKQLKVGKKAYPP